MNKKYSIIILCILLIAIFIFYNFNKPKKCINHTEQDIKKESIKWISKNNYIHQKIGICKFCNKKIILKEESHKYIIKKVKNVSKGVHEFSGQCMICKKVVSSKHPCIENRIGDCQVCFAHVKHIYDENGDCRGKHCEKHKHVLNIYGKCKGKTCKYCEHKYTDAIGDCLGCGKHIEHIMIYMVIVKKKVAIVINIFEDRIIKMMGYVIGLHSEG